MSLLVDCQATGRSSVAAREVIVRRQLTREEALEALTPALEPRYEVTRTPADDELYVKRFPGTYAIVKVAPLSDDRTSFRVRADWGLASFIWLYGRLVSSKQVAHAVDRALN
jgi:hypothetical protein